MAHLTAEFARTLLDYRPETGEFFWKVGRGGVLAGSAAGHKQKFSRGQHYRVIRIFGLYLAHRLAWLIVHGDFPAGHLDHKNGDTLDNRITNLRVATQSQNMQNTALRSDNTSSMKGVSWDKENNKWVVRIREPRGKYKNLGRFSDERQAQAAYAAAAKSMFGEFARIS